ncbi:Uncharacterized membrane protein [Halovenus aranensis]|uniref:Uncharacterized membrane protein n=1 Tax=Halovenus aranensis TaxID=890420 RepID=A0A1G8TQ15_9EURY|nr:DUF502 domain-containing protein [Halovenus aranensis]SDJ43504.1 Uncharacterized membrane protein [Halovenus aranensis]
MSLRSGIRDSFIAGIVLVTPLVITLYVLQLLSGFAFQVIDPVVQGTSLASYTANVEVVARVIAALLIVFIITALGFLAQKKTGQRLFGSLGRSVTLIPIFRTVYTTVRQISKSFSSAETSYDSLVLVEFPRKNVYTIGLITSESPNEVSEVAGATVYNVFLPSSPNPASGRLVLVPEDEIHEVDLSVRQGMGLLMTTGAGSERSGPVPAAVDMSPEAAVQSLEQRAPDESEMDDRS